MGNKINFENWKKSSWINKSLKFQCVDPYPLDQQDFGILDPDQQDFGSLDPDPQYFGSLDPDPQKYAGPGSKFQPTSTNKNIFCSKKSQLEINNKTS